MKVRFEELTRQYAKGKEFLVINDKVWCINYSENARQAYILCKRSLGKNYTKRNEAKFLTAKELNELVGYELGAVREV